MTKQQGRRIIALETLTAQDASGLDFMRQTRFSGNLEGATMKLSHLCYDEIAVACDHAKDHGLGEDTLRQLLIEAKKRHLRVTRWLRVEGWCYLRYFYRSQVVEHFKLHLPSTVAYCNNQHYPRQVVIFEAKTMEHILRFFGTDETLLEMYMGRNPIYDLKGKDHERKEPAE